MNGPGGDSPVPYRPDIDGLRALSVTAVVLFHAAVPGFAGGFIGVDVFFVISGYLITQWLEGRATAPPAALLREFYLRRARRILPALGLMLGVSTLLAWSIFLPADLARFGKYLLGAVFMAGNFVAWTEGDYFNSAVGFVPLLHLWSIAVEEQFYLLFPLLMLALRRAPPPWRCAVIAVLAAGSFALSVVMSYAHPVANFYLGPTRAWELMLGALLSCGMLDAAARRFPGSLAAAGLSAVIVSMLSFNGGLHHPGLPTLLPVLGAAALIAAGRARSTPAAYLLSRGPCVIVGRASYSLYLWHLPPLVFATYYRVDALAPQETVGVLTASLALAGFAWWDFEEPLRRRRWLPADARFVAAMVALFAALAIVGGSWWLSDGSMARVTAAERRLIDSAVLHPDAHRCMSLAPAEIAAGQLCHFGSTAPSAPRALLWGDSHALSLLPAFEALAVRENFSLSFAGTSACRPLPGYLDPARMPAAQRICTAYNDAMQRATDILRPDLVILAAFWAYPGPGMIRARDGASVPLSEALRLTTAELATVAHRVCLVRDVPVLRYSVPYAWIMLRRRGLETGALGIPDARWVPRQRATNAVLDSLANAPAVRVMDPGGALCAAGTCRIERDGEVLYRDSNHLSVQGALYVADSLAGCFANLRR